MHDPITTLLIQLAVLLAAAKVAGWISVKVGQPAVLGEILIGILLGNVTLLGFHGFEPMKTDPILAILASQ